MGVGVEEFGVGVCSHLSFPTWKKHECGYFSVVCCDRVNSIFKGTMHELIITHRMADREARKFG